MPAAAASRFGLIVVGTSLGGVDALQLLLRQLNPGFPLPIAVVQHRGVDNDTGLVLLLQTHCVLPLTEVEDKDAIRPGHVYLAPPDYHLLVEAEGRFSLSVDEKVNHARPSIDVLFESAANAYKSRVLAVVLTGSSQDGAAGAASVKRRGGHLVVQQPSSATADAMPRAALAAADPDKVLPLGEICAYLMSCAER